MGTLPWHVILNLFLTEIQTLLTCNSTDLLWHTSQKIQHYFHCLPAHKLHKLLHADTVTILAFPNNLKSLPVPLCLSAFLLLYSQITAIGPTQSLHYRIEEQLENKVYSFSLSPPSAPYRTLLST